MSKVLSGSLLVVGLAVVAGTLAEAGGQVPTHTVITVEKMHCDGCAKRIGGKLQEVPGVAKIMYDVKKKTFWLHPQDGKQLSPRLLWEAVEKGDDRPLELHGPTGKFTKKPKV